MKKNIIDDLINISQILPENKPSNSYEDIQDVRGFKKVAEDEYSLLNISKPLEKYINRSNCITSNRKNWPLKEYVNHPYVSVNVFSETECKQIIDSVKSGKISSPLNYSTTGGGFQEHIQTSKIRISPISWLYSDDAENFWIFEKIVKAIEQTNNEFFNYDLQEMESLQFTVYDSEEKGFYGKHIDTDHNPTRGGIRKLSLSIQLSDPQDYEGGDLLLYFGENSTKLSKSQGSGTFFPSYTLHEVTPVTKGIRYSLVAWVTGPKFK